MSTEEDEEILRKKRIVLSGDAEKVVKAKEILEEHRDELEGKDELKEKVEDLQNKLGLIAEKAFDKKKAELGCSDSSIDTPDKLFAWEKGKTGKSDFAGSAPLNSAQMGQGENSDILKRKFANHAELVKFLKDNESDPEVKKYYDALWKQTIQAMKNGSKIEYNPQTELKNESSQPVEIRLTGKERNDPNSELQQFLERANKKWRESKTRESERKKQEVVKS